MDHEEPLAGGNASSGVVRVGDTVRKPWLATTERTASYVRALRERGVDVPLVRGRDEAGRQIIDFVPGRLAMYDAPLALATIRRAGALVRSIHDASAGLRVPDDWDVLIPATHPDLLCHGDLATWNLIVDGDRLVFIDWDGAGPSTALWDLAHASISFGHLFPDAEPTDAAGRLAAFIAGYDPEPAMRTALVITLADRARAMHELLRRSHEQGREPWASMYTGGHGDHWASTTAYLDEHQDVWRAALA